MEARDNPMMMTIREFLVRSSKCECMPLIVYLRRWKRLNPLPPEFPADHQQTSPSLSHFFLFTSTPRTFDFNRIAAELRASTNSDREASSSPRQGLVDAAPSGAQCAVHPYRPSIPRFNQNIPRIDSNTLRHSGRCQLNHARLQGKQVGQTGPP